MKKYKHKRLGYIVEWVSESCVYWIMGPCKVKTISKELVENSCDWEEIKDYEILSFMFEEELTTLRDNGKYVWIGCDPIDCPDGLGATLEEMLDEQEYPGCEIYSVRRLSDGEIFTVGDRIEGYKNTGIKRIYIDRWGNLRITTDANGDGCLADKIDWDINRCVKIKPLLITEDGVSIYEEDAVYFVTDTFIYGWYSRVKGRIIISTAKYFSTEEKAREYIEDNKPMYSKKQLMDAAKKLDITVNILIESI